MSQEFTSLVKFSQARPRDSSAKKNMFTTVTLQSSKALQHIIHILCSFQHLLILKLMALLLDWRHVSVPAGPKTRRL